MTFKMCTLINFFMQLFIKTRIIRQMFNSMNMTTRSNNYWEIGIVILILQIITTI